MGLRGRRRNDDVGFRRSRDHVRAQRRGRRAPRRPAADGSRRQRPDGVLPQPGDRRHFAPHPSLRHSRLRDLGAHRLRVGRPGARHGDEAHSPRRRRLRARRRLRFDDQPDRNFRILPPVGALAGQRNAAAREPAVRCDAQRLPAGRGRRLPRARGMGVGAPPRRADLRGARGRRQFAVELSDHRFATRWRRTHPGDARGARRRRRARRRRSTT